MEEIAASDEYTFAQSVYALDWTPIYFENFQTVDYSKLATIVALRTAQDVKAKRTQCRDFQDFFTFPSDGWACVNTNLLQAVGGQIQVTEGGSFDRTAYVKPSIPFEWEIRLGHENSASRSTFGVKQDNDNQLRFIGQTGVWVAQKIQAGSTSSVVTSESIDTDWHVYKILSNGTSAKFYIDASQVASIDFSNFTSTCATFFAQDVNNSKVDYISTITNRET
jgi:hypothetical protein